MITFLRDIVLTWLLARVGLRGCLGCGCLLVLMCSVTSYVVISAIVSRF